MAAHNELGKKGEMMAIEYLKKKGYQILQHNWKLNNWEIDIIAQKKNEIIFVEVKTRSDNYLMQPEDAVDYRRQRRMTNAANAYINYYRVDLEPRFDIIAIILNDNRKEINNIEDAFPPTAY